MGNTLWSWWAIPLPYNLFKPLPKLPNHIKVSQYGFSEYSYKVELNGEKQLNVVFTPANASNKKIKWSTSNHQYFYQRKWISKGKLNWIDNDYCRIRRWKTITETTDESKLGNLHPCQSASLGGRIDNIYEPIYVWEFTCNGISYHIQKQYGKADLYPSK